MFYILQGFHAERLRPAAGEGRAGGRVSRAGEQVLRGTRYAKFILQMYLFFDTNKIN